ncbi:hypothetical protein [Natrinema sp. H-ect4]|uniref:hypothetical protein n=1 Tax=Natrinema sp. H-ect4 TaxID=3242699 RepID=UPI0035A88702
MNEGKVDSLGKHLSEKQKESVADAFKLTDMRITTARHSSATSEKRKMPRNKSLSVMAGGQNTDIITTSSQSIRDDIGKKWGWKK